MMLRHFEAADDILNLMCYAILLSVLICFVSAPHKILNLALLEIFFVEDFLHSLMRLVPFRLLLDLALLEDHIRIFVDFFQMTLVLFIIQTDTPQASKVLLTG